MHALKKGGQWEEAISVMQSLLDQQQQYQQKLQPQLSVEFGAGAGGDNCGGDGKDKAANKATPAATSVKPNVVMYSTAVAACQAGGDWLSALELL